MKIRSNLSHLVVIIGLSLIAEGSSVAQINACDLNSDGGVNVVDVQLAINMALSLSPCTMNIDGAGVCNVAVLQRVINAALGGGCLTNHWVSLSWTASTSPNIIGYNIYRGTALNGPFAKVNLSLITTTNIVDNTVAGQTYFYVATAVDKNNNESAFSSPPVQAIVPSP